MKLRTKKLFFAGTSPKFAGTSIALRGGEGNDESYGNDVFKATERQRRLLLTIPAVRSGPRATKFEWRGIYSRRGHRAVTEVAMAMRHR